MDTSCAALMKLAATVHGQGYKVALTGEGADEALAGYVWFKTQAIREQDPQGDRHGLPLLARKFLLAAVGGGSAHRAPLLGIGGVRTAQQDMYELIGQARPILYTPGMWERLGDHNPYDDLSLPSADKMKRWHPMNQSLYVGYKVMLAGLLMISKGDRISMHSSVETRYPFLDDDVIEFCSKIAPEYKLRGRTEKWILRQVAAKTLPAGDRQPAQDDVPLAVLEDLPRPGHPAWVDQLLSPESLRKTGYFDPEMVKRERMKQQALPRVTARRFVMDIALTCVVATQLWHHLFFGGLCDLPTWTPPQIDETSPPTNGQLDDKLDREPRPRSRPGGRDLPRTRCRKFTLADVMILVGPRRSGSRWPATSCRRCRQPWYVYPLVEVARRSCSAWTVALLGPPPPRASTLASGVCSGSRGRRPAWPPRPT